MRVDVSSMRPPGLAQTTAALNKGLITAYRILGFVVLTAVLVGLSSYIGLNIIYLLHRQWVAPVIISPTDARVLDLSARIAQETYLRQKVTGEQAALNARINKAKRIIALEKAYQEGFREAVRADAAARRGTMHQLGALTADYRRAKQEIEQPSQSFAELSKERTEQQFAAKLIDQDTVIARNQQLSQLAQSRLSLRQQQVELNTRLSSMSRDVSAFESLAQDPQFLPAGKALSYEGLNIAHQFHQSVLAAQTAEDELASAEQELAALGKAVAHYDGLVKTLESATLVRASTQKLTVAFVPYDNATNAAPGVPVYGCAFQVIWCKRAGTVKAVLEGEVVAKHPLYGWDMRGQFLELDVEDAQAMKLPVLHLNRKPLFL